MASQFSHPDGPERAYISALRKVARVVGGIVRSHVVGSTLRDEAQLMRMLTDYSGALGPYAETLSAHMVASVSRANLRAFQSALSQSMAKQIGQGLRSSMEESVVGRTAKLLQVRQVELIKSLPLEAGLRAQNLAREAVMGGTRASEVAAELANTEAVTEARATLIARTEIAKANAAITQARAELVGADSYIWETAEDGDVRESHAEMQGKPFEFNNPPTLSDGMTGNPGEFPNCRCFAVPVIPGVSD